MERYRIHTLSRGKEFKLILEEVGGDGRMVILFRFGMTMCFTFTGVNTIPKHSRLLFFTTTSHVLSFCDYRGFGTWFVGGDWEVSRRPCVVIEYEQLRRHIATCLRDGKLSGQP